MDITEKLAQVADTKGIDILAKHLVCYEARAEIERLRAQLLETQLLSHDWMAKHDRLLGFIQARPAVLKELIAIEQSSSGNGQSS